MLHLARGVVVAVFGDDVLRLALYVVVGILALGFLETSAATTALFAQPMGQYWFAGQLGAPAQVAAPGGGAAQPPAAPVPGVILDRASAIIANAMTWLGTRYLWGGCSVRGIDCSCFVQNVLRAAGVQGVPRTTVTQIAWTRPVSAAQMQAADILYWDNTCSGCGGNPTHVGIYLGDGRMVHCGDPCRVESIETAYWRSHWNSAGRIP